MKLLLHICCAPCANRPLADLQAQGHDVTGFWYNPNIHPFTEYRARRNTVRDYLQEIGVPLIEQNDYGLRPFVRAVAEDIPGRCVKCYEMRLFRAAEVAKAQGFDGFTSSLFISPYQKHDLMKEVAERRRKPSAWHFTIRIFVRSSAPGRTSPGSTAFTCRNTAAASSPRRSGT